MHGSQRVARAAYQLINESYPDAPGREDNLYYLAMTTWQLGEADKGGELVAQHLKEFPNSKYAPMLNTLSLEGLLKEKKFDLCVQQADKVMELHKDDPTHKFYELALYCKGASLFNLRAADASRYKEAVPVLERFVKEYRDSTYLKTAMYLLGETYTNLGNTDEAIRSFTNYIARFPDKGEANMAAVLYDRAFNYLNRKNSGDEELAAKDAKEIVDNFKDHRLFPYANNLLANLYAGSKEHEQEAEGYFLAALESAKKLGDKRPAAEAVYNLFINATKKPLPVEPKEAVETARTARRDEVKKWYDEYWKDSDQPGSRYSLQLAAAAMDFFKDDKEMFDPASVKMQEIIVREGKKDDPKMTVLLEEAVNSYTKTYMAGNQALGRNLDANAMRNHFYRFPGVDNDKDKTLSAMLRMAVIAQTQERYEKAPVETDEQRAEKAALEGLVKQLFVELKRDFKPSDLPPYTLVKLGMHLAGTSQPEESISYFDEILDPSEPDPVRKKARINGMSKYRKNAVFGKAVALGRSKDNAKVDEKAVKAAGAAGVFPGSQCFLEADGIAGVGVLVPVQGSLDDGVLCGIRALGVQAVGGCHHDVAACRDLHRFSTGGPLGGRLGVFFIGVCFRVQRIQHSGLAAIGGVGGTGNAVDLGALGVQQRLLEVLGRVDSQLEGLVGGVHLDLGDGGLREGHGDGDVVHALCGGSVGACGIHRCTGSCGGSGSRGAGGVAGRQSTGGDTAHGGGSGDLQKALARDLFHEISPFPFFFFFFLRADVLHTRDIFSIMIKS